MILISNGGTNMQRARAVYAEMLASIMRVRCEREHAPGWKPVSRLREALGTLLPLA